MAEDTKTDTPSESTGVLQPEGATVVEDTKEEERPSEGISVAEDTKTDTPSESTGVLQPEGATVVEDTKEEERPSEGISVAEDTKTDTPSESTGVLQPEGATVVEDTKEEERPSDSKPNWSKWNSCRQYEVFLRDAVALSCNFEGEVLDEVGAPYVEAAVLTTYYSRLNVAILADGVDLHLHWVPDDDGDNRAKVHLGGFAKWALDKEARQLDLWKGFPPDFSKLAEEEPTLLWPWGNYTTDLLDALKAAVEKFWKKQDPDAVPTDGPDTMAVVKYLVGQRVPGTSPTAAAAIDKIIRHNKWKRVTHKGAKRPRKKSSAKS